MFKSRDSIPFALIPYGSITFHCTSTRVVSAASLNTVIFKTQDFFLLLFSQNRPVSYIFRNIAEVRHTATWEYSLFSTHLTLFQGLQLALCTLMLFHDCITVIIFWAKRPSQTGIHSSRFCIRIGPPQTLKLSTPLSFLRSVDLCFICTCFTPCWQISLAPRRKSLWKMSVISK